MAESIFAANKLATPWIFRVRVGPPPKKFKTEFILECAHSRLRGFCIAHSLSTSLPTQLPPSDAPPPPHGFIAGPKHNPEALRTPELTFLSGVLRLIGECDDFSVDMGLLRDVSLAEGGLD